jgi:hypothetical protein
LLMLLTFVILTADRDEVLIRPRPVTFSPPFTKRVDAKSVEGKVGVPVGGG